MKQWIDYSGNVFGKLTVIGVSERVLGKTTKWNCVCECGKSIVVSSNQLQSGSEKSCGCVRFSDTHWNTSVRKHEYYKIHRWINKKYGRSITCEKCQTKTASKYEWALKKGYTYEKNIDNFFQLCKSCHAKYDFDETKRKHPIRIIPPLIHRIIIQYDKEMNKISEHASVTHAAKYANQYTSAIANHLSGRSKSCGGFIWKYKNIQ